MTPEGRIRDYLRKQTLAHGGEHRKLGWIGRRNAPDELIFWKVPVGMAPITAFVECKAPGKKATEAQTREHVRLRDGGFGVAVVASEKDVDMLISGLTGRVRRAWMSVDQEGRI